MVCNSANALRGLCVCVNSELLTPIDSTMPKQVYANLSYPHKPPL